MYKRDQIGSSVSVISENIVEINVQKKCQITETEAADFEEAISATKFGIFNIILILVAIPSGWASIFETTTMSYVFPAAQCDLDLSLEDKGLLNAVTYIGMMSSGLIWGYLCDTLGRKRLLYIGYFLDAFFVIMGSVSQTFTILMVSKFFGGFIINGPYAALTAYLSEFHCAKYRAVVLMVLGTIFSAATIILPILAQIILPTDIDFTILDTLRIHSWNVFIFASAAPSLLAGCFFFFLPESPKFLMTSGKNEQAMKVFQLAYRINTGKPRDTFPITKLVDERHSKIVEPKTEEQSGDEKKKEVGWRAIQSLFRPPLVTKVLLICGLQVSIIMSLNTLRLWIPQLFQAISDYQLYNNGTSADLCTMLGVITPNNVTASEECTTNTDNFEVYINSTIIAITTLCAIVVAGSLINFLGKKRLLCVLGIVGGLSAYCLYFATGTVMTLIFIAINISMSSIGLNVVLTVVVDLFPTSSRTMAVQVAMISGRLGAMGGNLLFPILLKLSCAAPFFSIGTVLLCGAFISQLLPNTDMKALQ